MNNLFRININIINYIKKPKISLSHKMKYFIPYRKDFLNIYKYKIRINFPNIYINCNNIFIIFIRKLEFESFPDLFF